MGNVAIFKGKLVKFLAKSGILIPRRPTSGRPLTAEMGETAFNTDTSKLEVYNGSSWVSLDEAGTLVHPKLNSTFEYNKYSASLGFPSGGTGNTSLGVGSGDSITTGTSNTLYGESAGTAIVGGALNTAVGSFSLTQVTSGQANSVLGASALSNVTTGSRNVAIGYNAGQYLADISSQNTIINSKGVIGTTPVALSGIVTIGTDQTLDSAAATADNDFVLGTSLHNYKLPGKVITPVILAAQNELRFADADSSNYVGFKAPLTISANKVWTLPAADGTTGQVLSTNGLGGLSWIDLPGLTPTNNFSFLDNQTAPANITGFTVPAVISSKYLVAVYREATSSKYETLEVLVVKRASDYKIAVTAVGDVSGVSLSITAAGQIQYTSTLEAGHNATNSKIYWKQLATL